MKQCKNYLFDYFLFRLVIILLVYTKRNYIVQAKENVYRHILCIIIDIYDIYICSYMKNLLKGIK